MVTVTAIEPKTGARATFCARSDLSLLDQLEDACPFALPSLCWIGACGTCALRLRRGRRYVDPEAFSVAGPWSASPTAVLPCIAGIRASAVADSLRHRVVVEVPAG